MVILVTGAAGFIGMHTANALLNAGYRVYGIDNLNSYYEPTLKKARLKNLLARPRFYFDELDIADSSDVLNYFDNIKPNRVVHLAAQAGVRYSIENPMSYADSNLKGFLSILEACRRSKVERLIYASSSSVYGNSQAAPFEEGHRTDSPVSLYAATKKANEVMAFSYGDLYDLHSIGLRFFTVYGPWGRPDMAYFSFTRAILEGRPISVYGEGLLERDFTYVDDIVEGILAVTTGVSKSAERGEGEGCSKIYNIGNENPVKVRDFIETLESILGRRALIDFKPMQLGDVWQTHASVDALDRDFGYTPRTNLKEGLEKFVEWYRGYYS